MSAARAHQWSMINTGQRFAHYDRAVPRNRFFNTASRGSTSQSPENRKHGTDPTDFRLVGCIVMAHNTHIGTRGRAEQQQRSFVSNITTNSDSSPLWPYCALCKRSPSLGLTFNDAADVKPVTPSSIMSSTLKSKKRAITRLCGRFFECDPTSMSDASFFSARNSSDDWSSKGSTGFSLGSMTAWGFFNAT